MHATSISHVVATISQRERAAMSSLLRPFCLFMCCLSSLPLWPLLSLSQSFWQKGRKQNTINYFLTNWFRKGRRWKLPEFLSMLGPKQNQLGMIDVIDV